MKSLMPEDKTVLFTIEVFAAPTDAPNAVMFGIAARLGLPPEALPPRVKELLDDALITLTEGVRNLPGENSEEVAVAQGAGTVGTKIGDYLRQQGVEIKPEGTNGETWH